MTNEDKEHFIEALKNIQKSLEPGNYNIKIAVIDNRQHVKILTRILLQLLED